MYLLLSKLVIELFELCVFDFLFCRQRTYVSVLLEFVQRNYVICQVMYKGEDGDVPSGGNNSSEPSQSMVSDSNTVRETITTAPEVSPLSLFDNLKYLILLLTLSIKF